MNPGAKICVCTFETDAPDFCEAIMKLRGPILTLVAVALLGLVVLLVNLRAAPGAPPPAAAGAAATTSASAEPAAAATPFPERATYTGQTQGKATGEAAVAVTVKGEKASSYVCDGKAVEAWYNGTAKDGKVELKGTGENVLTGTLNGDTITGTVSAGGKSWPFTAKLVQKPAGLYRASGGGTTTGWIQQPNGTVTGLRSDGQPAGPLDTSTAESVEGDTDVVN